MIFTKFIKKANPLPSARWGITVTSGMLAYYNKLKLFFCLVEFSFFSKNKYNFRLTFLF